MLVTRVISGRLSKVQGLQPCKFAAWQMTNMRISNLPADIQNVRAAIAYLQFIDVPDTKSFVIVDAGIPLTGKYIIHAAEKRYGKDCTPEALILTHGHFDHVGGIHALLNKWKSLKVYAHQDEIKYLTGKEDYPPADTKVGGGLMTLLSPLYPRKAINLGNRVMPLPSDNTIPYLSEWKWVHTPGHTPGHVSFWRERDRTLIVGDAFTTTKQESASSVAFQTFAVRGPPMYFTQDWQKSKTSVEKLQKLDPAYAYLGHGRPIYGSTLSDGLYNLVKHFDTVAVPANYRIK